MSHFTVLVIGDNPEGQLAPYQENCPDEYLKFNDVEKEYKEKYETETITKVLMHDGRKLNVWDREFQQGDLLNKKTVIPTHLEQRVFTMKELYPTFDKYMKDYCGYEKNNNGKYGYWENPNAKWDWYSLGGRWAGFFTLKPGAKGAQGHHRAKDFAIITGEIIEDIPGIKVDQCFKKDIDFERMKLEARADALLRYNKFIECLDGEQMPPKWDEFRKSYGNIEDARNKYHKIKAVKNLNSSKNYFFSFDEFICTEQEYCKQAEQDVLRTFAVLKDREWYELGEMGWFGFHSNENPEWNKDFDKLFNSIDDNTLLSVFDCHI